MGRHGAQEKNRIVGVYKIKKIKVDVIDSNSPMANRIPVY